LEYSPGAPEGLAALAAVEGYYHWNWKRAEELLQQAISANDRYETAHHLYSMGCLMPQARFDEALREIQIAQEINPLSFFVVTCVGIVYYYQRNHDEAIKTFDRALSMHPKYHLAHWHRGWALAELGRHDEAIRAISAAVETTDNSPPVLAALAQEFAAAGQVADCHRIVKQLRQIASERYVSPYDLALVETSLGEDKKALDLLREAVGQRVPMLARLRVHPVFDRYRSYPEFQQILRSVNLLPTDTSKARPSAKAEKKHAREPKGKQS
jgi:tetratricopeptide (TPR) repeat protein